MKHSIIFSLQGLLVTSFILLNGCIFLDDDNDDGASSEDTDSDGVVYDVQEAQRPCLAELDNCTSCSKISKRGKTAVHYDGYEGRQFAAFCSDDGWTLLAVGRGGSESWGSLGDHWDARFGGTNVRDFSGDASSTEDQRTFGYSRLKTNKIKLCYRDEDHCFIFNHGQHRTLASFFQDEYDDASHIEAGADAPSDFLDKLGFRALGNKEDQNQIKCFRLGINLPKNRHVTRSRSKGKIGLIGYTKTCDLVDENTENELALGLGMLSYEGLTTNAAGFSRYVDRADGIQQAPNPQVVGPWLVFGK